MYIQTTECQLCNHIESQYTTSEGNPCDAQGNIIKRSKLRNEKVTLPDGEVIWICDRCTYLLKFLMND